MLRGPRLHQWRRARLGRPRGHVLRKADCLVSRGPLGDWCTGGRDEGPASSAPITRPYQGLEGRHRNIIQRVHLSKCANCVVGIGYSTSKASAADDLEPGNVTQHHERLRL